MQASYFTYDGPKEKDEWKNHCDLCNLKPGATKHTPGACCVSCRNYELIDDAATHYTLVDVKSWPVNPETGVKAGTTIGEYLSSTEQAENNLIQLVNTLQPIKAEVSAARESLNNLSTKWLKKEISEDAFKLAKTPMENNLQSLMAQLIEASRNVTVAGELLNKNVQRVIATIARQLLRTVEADMHDFGRKNESAYWLSLDEIDRARFIFVWIASSIVYDSKILERHESGRTQCNTLRGGIEECAGLGHLFRMMFDTSRDLSLKRCDIEAIKDEQDSMSCYIEGTASMSAPTIAGPKHGWNTFPFENHSGQREWKIIDVTGAVDAQVEGMRDTKSLRDGAKYFTRPNEWFHQYYTVRTLFAVSRTEKDSERGRQLLGLNESAAVTCKHPEDSDSDSDSESGSGSGSGKEV